MNSKPKISMVIWILIKKEEDEFMNSKPTIAMVLTAHANLFNWFSVTKNIPELSLLWLRKRKEAKNKDKMGNTSIIQQKANDTVINSGNWYQREA